MKRTHDDASPPHAAFPAGSCGRANFDISGPGTAAIAALASADLAAEAAAREACQVSALLAAAAISLTNLTPEAMPRLLRHP